MLKHVSLFFAVFLLLLFDARVLCIGVNKDGAKVTCKEKPFVKQFAGRKVVHNAGKLLDCAKTNMERFLCNSYVSNCNFAHVRVLDVSSNFMKSITAKSFPNKLEKLEGLYLQNNKLTNFFNDEPNFAREILKHLTVLTLGDNPLSCSCKMSWLWKDYKGIYEILPRNLLGFHVFNKTISDDGISHESKYPPLTCYDKEDGEKTWDEIDLSRCVDKFSGSAVGEWTAWSACSVSCGKGILKRERECNRAQPLMCAKKSEEIQQCVKPACKPVITAARPKLTAWSHWSDCSVTCGNGIRNRARNCTESPLICSEPLKQTKRCVGRIGKCMKGYWSSWSSFGDCIKLCPTRGFQVREKFCFSNGKLSDKKNCREVNNSWSGFEYASCAIGTGKDCLSDWSQWTAWSKCSAFCNTGSRSRTRVCKKKEGRSGCVGLRKESELCRAVSCEEAKWRSNGGWDVWSIWAPCPKECSQKHNTTRTRDCNYRNKTCHGISRQTKLCNPIPCYGDWAEWSSWIPCSVSCGDGIRLRRRKCSNSSYNVPCLGFDTDISYCKDASCPKPVQIVYNVLGNASHPVTKFPNNRNPSLTNQSGIKQIVTQISKLSIKSIKEWLILPESKIILAAIGLILLTLVISLICCCVCRCREMRMTEDGSQSKKKKPSGRKRRTNQDASKMDVHEGNTVNSDKAENDDEFELVVDLTEETSEPADKLESSDEAVKDSGNKKKTKTKIRSRSIAPKDDDTTKSELSPKKSHQGIRKSSTSLSSKRSTHVKRKSFAPSVEKSSTDLGGTASKAKDLNIKKSKTGATK